MKRNNVNKILFKMKKDKNIIISAPGRICLLGEHQDYFGLPVISAAIDLRIRIRGTGNKDRIFKIEMPDIGERDVIELYPGDFTPQKERDYLRSCLTVLARYGYKFDQGYDCKIESTIPIGKGVSSSSAMVVAWIKFLLTVSKSQKTVTEEELAELAYQAEVKEFNEPGGMQDHYCASLGGLLYIDSGSDGDFVKKTEVTKLDVKFKEFVLGDSLEQKDTKGVLNRIKTSVYSAVEKIREEFKAFDFRKTQIEDIRNLLSKLPEEPRLKLEATLMTRDLTREVKGFFDKKGVDAVSFGRWLDKQHSVLKDGLQISTKKIEELILAAKSAGALGCKINGSGGGGCFLAFAPGKEKEVIEAIEQAGGRGYSVGIDSGVNEEGENHASP